MRPRRGPERAPAEPQTRINEAIRVPQVRLIDSDGEQIGIKSRDEALEYAWAKNLDLVEVAPDARPPVCRVMDYSKYKYEQEQKAKLARKHQSTITIKEIKLRPKVGSHDYETKKGHVERFLTNRDKVKVTIMFRGRETSHPERGRDLLLRLASDVKELGVIESEPLQDGRNMVMMLAPVKERPEVAGAPKAAPVVEAAPPAAPRTGSRRDIAAAERAAARQAGHVQQAEAEAEAAPAGDDVSPAVAAVSPVADDAPTADEASSQPTEAPASTDEAPAARARARSGA